MKNFMKVVGFTILTGATVMNTLILFMTFYVAEQAQWQIEKLHHELAVGGIVSGELLPPTVRWVVPGSEFRPSQVRPPQDAPAAETTPVPPGQSSISLKAPEPFS